RPVPAIAPADGSPGAGVLSRSIEAAEPPARAALRAPTEAQTDPTPVPGVVTLPWPGSIVAGPCFQQSAWPYPRGPEDHRRRCARGESRASSFPARARPWPRVIDALRQSSLGGG